MMTYCQLDPWTKYSETDIKTHRHKATLHAERPLGSLNQYSAPNSTCKYTGGECLPPHRCECPSPPIYDTPITPIKMFSVASMNKTNPPLTSKILGASSPQHMSVPHHGPTWHPQKNCIIYLSNTPVNFQIHLKKLHQLITGQAPCHCRPAYSFGHFF